MLNILSCYALMALMGFLIYVGIRLGIRDQYGLRPLFSANNVMLILFILYVFLSAALSIVFNNFEFTWATNYSGAEYALPTLVLCIGALAIYIYAYRFFLSTRRSVHLAHESPDASRLVTTAALVLTSIGLGLKIYVFFAMGGLRGSVTQMSPGLIESLAIANLDYTVSTVRNLSGISEVAVVWMLVVSIRRRQGLLLWGALFSVTMILVYMAAAKRSYLIEPFVAIILAYHFYIRKLRLWLLPFLLAATLVFGMGSLFVRAVLPATINDIEISPFDVPWAHGTWLGFYFYSLEFSTFETMTIAIQEYDKIIALFGSSLEAFYTTNIEPIFYVVPRVVWPGKPLLFIDLSMAMTAVIFGQSLGASEWGTAASYIGNSWVLGGAFGVVGYSTFLAWLAASSDWYLFRSSAVNKDIAINVFSVALFSAFVLWRQGSLGYSFIQLVPNQIGYLAGFVILFILSKRQRPENIMRKPNFRSKIKRSRPYEA